MTISHKILNKPIHQLNKDIILNNKIKVALSSLVLVLSACDDSDEPTTDTGGGTPAVVNTTPVTISSDNVEEVTSTAISSSFNNMAIGVSDGFIGVVVEDEAVKNNILDADWALSQLKKLPQVTDSFTGVSTSDTEDCYVSGSQTFTFTVQDPTFQTVSAGDSIKFVANNCDDGYGETNGTFTMTYTHVVDFDGYDDFTTLGIDISFSDYSVAVSSEDVVMSGSYSIIMNKGMYTETVDTTSDKLVTEIASYQTAIEDLIVKQVYDKDTGIKTLVTSSIVSDSFIGGSVTVSTIEELSFPYQWDYTPTSGVLKVVGASGSSVLITVSDDSVQLDADFNGDGTIDETTTTTWTSLTYY